MKERVKLVCGYCDKKFERRASDIRWENVFCSKSCSVTVRNIRNAEKNLLRTKKGYRIAALKYYEHKCSNPKCELIKCGIQIPIIMIDVDHIDNDRKNNAMTNLQLLCVWCHTLKTRNVI